MATFQSSVINGATGLQLGGVAFNSSSWGLFQSDRTSDFTFLNNVQNNNDASISAKDLSVDVNSASAAAVTISNTATRTSGAEVSITTASGQDAVNIAQGDVTLTSGDLTLSSGAISASGAVQGGSLTDGTATLSSGALSNATTVTASGAVTGGSLTDGTATMASGALSGVTTIAASGVVTAGGLTVGDAVLSEADLEQLDDITAGTAAASKAVVLDANKDIDGLRHLDATGTLTAASFTDGTASLTAGVWTGVDALTATNAITGGSLTDGTATLSSGNLTGAVAITASGAVTGGSFTDGTATLSSGALSGVTTIAASGSISANGGIVIANQTATYAKTDYSAAGATSLVNKGYVDSIAQGVDAKDSVNYATAAALPACTYDNAAGTLTADANGVLTVDGETVAVGETLLVKDQANAKQNGIYECTTAGAVDTSFVLTRRDDMDASGEFSGAYVLALEGSVNGYVGFVCTNTTAVTIGDGTPANDSDINWTQFTGVGTLDAGAALSKTGNTIDVEVDDSSIEISGDALQVKASGITNAMLAGSIDNSKLNTLNTADLVSVSALDIDSATDIGAALADADLLIVDDGGAGTNRSCAMTRVPTYVFSKVTGGDVLINSSGEATIQAGSVEGTMLNANTVDDNTIEISQDSLRLKAIADANINGGGGSVISLNTSLTGMVAVSFAAATQTEANTALTKAIHIDADMTNTTDASNCIQFGGDAAGSWRIYVKGAGSGDSSLVFAHHNGTNWNVLADSGTARFTN